MLQRTNYSRHPFHRLLQFFAKIVKILRIWIFFRNFVVVSDIGESMYAKDEREFKGDVLDGSQHALEAGWRHGEQEAWFQSAFLTREGACLYGQKLIVRHDIKKCAPEDMTLTRWLAWRYIALHKQ